ncbi:MAG: hypothetical protein ABSE48_18195, partial [Verrucomicrobiota bacterium]
VNDRSNRWPQREQALSVRLIGLKQRGQSDRVFIKFKKAFDNGMLEVAGNLIKASADGRESPSNSLPRAPHLVRVQKLGDRRHLKKGPQAANAKAEIGDSIGGATPGFESFNFENMNRQTKTVTPRLHIKSARRLPPKALPQAFDSGGEPARRLSRITLRSGPLGEQSLSPKFGPLAK